MTHNRISRAPSDEIARQTPTGADGVQRLDGWSEWAYQDAERGADDKPALDEAFELDIHDCSVSERHR